jgi:hypothetical protein
MLCACLRVVHALVFYQALAMQLLVMLLLEVTSVLDL